MKTRRTPEWVGIPIQYTESEFLLTSQYLLFMPLLFEITSVWVLQPSSPVFSVPQSRG